VRCSFLRESLVQFCAASPRPTYVPWSESPDLRCAHDGHRYCELFLAAAGARGPAFPCVDPDETGTAVVDGVPMPGWLFYADNHMWLDAGDDGLCHLGVDAFLTRLIGTVERLTFLTVKGDVRPAVVLTVGGVDLTLVFGRQMPLVAANTRLRSGLEHLVEDPYGLGWLFTARSDEGQRGLRHGRAAREWMASEVGRLSTVVHELLLHPRAGVAAPADGGRRLPATPRARGRAAPLRRVLPPARRNPECVMTRRGLLFFSAGLVLALALGWVGFPCLLYARAEQPLRFSHKTHVSDKTGFGCADCHGLGEDGRFAGIPGIDNCAGCHGRHGESDTLPDHDTNRITGYSRQLWKMSDCEGCHAEHLRERTACLACHK